MAHDEEGAVGLLLNRRTEAEVAEAVPELADLVDAEAVVSIGGPVQTEAVVVLADWAAIAIGNARCRLIRTSFGLRSCAEATVGESAQKISHESDKNKGAWDQ